MAFRILNRPDEVAAYARSLDERWPERDQVAAHIADLVTQARPSAMRVLELCAGPGKLAAAILERAPVAEYASVDISAASLAYAAQRLQGRQAAMTWLAADLNDDQWLQQISGPFDAVVSMQSVHDLGGEREVGRIYGIARSLLAERGVFINADLATELTDPIANPGRFSLDRHMALLHGAGFAPVRCTLRLGDFGCFEAHTRPIHIIPHP